jgi:spore maturation protein CgeB
VARRDGAPSGEASERQAPLKFTIFGLTLSSSWGNGHATPYRAILKALDQRGHQVTFYEKDVPFYALRRDFEHCDFCHLVLYRNWDEIRGRVLPELGDTDVVLNASYCPEGARIIDDVLNVSGPLHVFYDLDTPITLAALEGGDVEYLRREQIPEFALYLSFTGGTILSDLETKWNARAARPLYGCVDPEVHAAVPRRASFQCLFSYMGTYAADRQKKLDALFLEPARRLSKDQFVLAGSLYPREWWWPANVRRFEHIAPADHPALYSSSRATLNITRGGMATAGYCPSGRFFEAAACGTPIVSDYFEGLQRFFTPGEEIMLASNAEEVVAALTQSAAELSHIAEAARARTLREHTGKNRAEELLSYLTEVKERRAKSEVA